MFSKIVISGRLLFVDLGSCWPQVNLWVCNSLFILFIFSANMLCPFCSHILHWNFVFYASGCWFVLVHFLLTSVVNYCFFNVLFCLFGWVLSRYLLSLPSLANNFSLFLPQILLDFSAVVIFNFSFQFLLVHLPSLSTLASYYIFFFYLSF